MSKVLYADNFNGNVLASFWQETSHAGSGVVAQNQRLEVYSDSNISGCVWVSTAIDMRNKYAMVEWVQGSDDNALFICPTIDPATGGDIWEEDNWYRIICSDTQLGLQRKDNGGTPTEPYLDSRPSIPFWARIRLTTTHIYLDYATSLPTQESDWTNLYSEAWAITAPISSAMYVGLVGWNTPTNGAPFFDDFRIVDLAVSANKTFTMDGAVDNFDEATGFSVGTVIGGYIIPA